METEIKMKKTIDNISSLKNGLNSLIKRTIKNEIIIKTAIKDLLLLLCHQNFT